MGFLADALSRKSGSTIDLIREVFGGRITGSGKAVNVRTAVQVSAVFACCRVIGEGLAQVPLKLMRESADGKSRLPAKDHPLYELLAFRPNDWMTSFEYRELLAWHVVLTGNHFSFINRGARGKILELIPFSPGQVTVKRADDWTLSYEVRTDDGRMQTFPAEAIWHVRGPSMDGWQGLEAVAIAREAIGLSMATEEASARLHKNGVRPSGTYSVEGTLSPDQYKALRNWISDNVAGSENTGAPLVMDRAAKWQPMTMTGIDAQSLETRRFQIEEICRFARVMPIMVGYSDKAATYASAEQMFLAHVVHTLAPWFQRIEQSIDANLLTAADRKAGVYSNFVEEGLLRGAAVDTKDVILGYVNGGILTPNEGRALLDRNPIDDEDSDKLRIPANIVGDMPDAETEPTGSSGEPDTTDSEAVKALRALEVEVKSLRDRPAPAAPAPQPITVKAGDTHITLSEGMVRTGDTTVNQPDVHVKAGDTHISHPGITVVPSEVTVKASDVTVPVTVMPAEVKVALPARKTSTVVERDVNGAIIAATQLEQDV